MASVQAPLTDAEFTSAVELLQRIIPKDEISPRTHSMRLRRRLSIRRL